MNRRDFLHTAGLGLTASLARAAEPVPVPDADAHIRQLAENAPLAMQFQGSTAADLRQWQAEFAAKLRTLLGPHAPPKEWKPITESSVDLGDHRRDELVLVAEGQPPLPVYRLVPNGKADKPRPGILALHGHGSHGYHPVAGRDDLPGVAAAIQGSNYDYGRQLVKKGYIVTVPCLTPFGRRLGNAASKQDPCAITFIRLQLLGKLLIAENLRDALWSLELLARDPRVDAERLGCVGLSYGGRMTTLTSAVEPRIKVAVISGALNVMQERVRGAYSCGAQIIPGLLQHGDIPEIASLIAPRHCLWEIGDQDGLIVPKWADLALTRIRRAYQAAGAPDRLQVDRFDGGHRWNGAKAVPLLDEVLRPSG